MMEKVSRQNQELSYKENNDNHRDEEKKRYRGFRKHDYYMLLM